MLSFSLVQLLRLGLSLVPSYSIAREYRILFQEKSNPAQEISIVGKDFPLRFAITEKTNTREQNSQCRTRREEAETRGSCCSARKRKTMSPLGISCSIRRQSRTISSRGVRVLTGTSYRRANASRSALRGKYSLFSRYARSSSRSMRRGSRGGGGGTRSVFACRSRTRALDGTRRCRRNAIRLWSGSSRKALLMFSNFRASPWVLICVTGQFLSINALDKFFC